jgi:hypothetical protein
MPETVLMQGPLRSGKAASPSRSVSTVFARPHPGQAGDYASGASPHHGDYCRPAASIMMVSPKTPTTLK